MCFLKTVVLIDVGIFAAVGVMCWLAGGCSACEYGVDLVWAGAAAIVLGLLALKADWAMRRGFGHRSLASVSGRRIDERVKQGPSDTTQSYGFLVRMLAVGAVSIVVGVLVQIASRCSR